MGMDVVIKSVGVIFILLGIAYIIKPGILKWLMRFMKKGGRIYMGALLRFALAVVFLLGAGECNNKWIIAAFGILFLLGGLLIIVMTPKRIRPIQKMLSASWAPLRSHSGMLHSLNVSEGSVDGRLGVVGSSAGSSAGKKLAIKKSTFTINPQIAPPIHFMAAHNR